MPSNTFPRPGEVDQALLSAGTPEVPGGYRMRSQTGVVNLRSSLEIGRTWSETYGPLNLFRPDTHEFLSWIRWAWSTCQVFSYVHPAVPGSGLTARGNPGGSPTIAAGQLGGTISTSGWTPGITNLLLPGDHIKIAGVNTLFEVLDPVSSTGGGAASINVWPEIYSSPAGGASITYDNISFNATFAQRPNLPQDTDSIWFVGLSLNFVEVP